MTGESVQQNLSERLECLSKDQDYFKSTIDLVPTSFYFSQGVQQTLHGKTEYDSDGDSEEEPDPIQVLEPSRGLSGKQAKFDPSQTYTVSRVQEQLIQKEEEAKRKKELELKKKRKHMKIRDEDDTSSLRSNTESLEDLRERLQSKIDNLRAKRKALDNKGDYVEMKRLKRQASKMKLKMRRKVEKHNTKKGNNDNVNGANLNKIKAPVPSGKPIYNKEGKMVFSKFDFSTSPDKDKKSDLPTGKNYKHLLKKVESQKAKMEKLKETNPEKAKTLAEKTTWQTVLQRAEGVKVKDNPELLKKSLKRKEKLQKKAGKQWEERKQTVDKRIEEKQEKRKKNIKARKNSKIDNKIKKAKKKGRVGGF